MEKHCQIGDACRVKLFDLGKGLAQRIEGQFRRDWSFVPALWNMYFKECLLSGHSISVRRVAEAENPTPDNRQSLTIALEEIYKHLEHGKYKGPGGKLMAIRGDITKLNRAIDMKPDIWLVVRKIIADVQFRTRKIPGTAEIRKNWPCWQVGLCELRPRNLSYDVAK